MTLSTLAILLGAGFAIPNALALAKPAASASAYRKFPRSEGWGYLLLAIGTAWFLYNLNHEAIAEFAAYKNLMLGGFGLIAVMACLFVRDFLAVRGLAVSLLLLAWYTLNLTRWAESPWRLVVVVWAYVWVVGSMWCMISPWRLRDYLNWLTGDPGRFKKWSAIHLAFGLLVAALGLLVF